MVKAHVTGLAGLWLLGFLCGEDVAGVAHVARGVAEAGALFLQLGDLAFALDAELVAAAAALHPFHKGHGLPMGRWHRLHRRPGQGVFSALELS